MLFDDVTGSMKIFHDLGWSYLAVTFVIGQAVCGEYEKSVLVVGHTVSLVLAPFQQVSLFDDFTSERFTGAFEHDLQCRTERMANISPSSFLQQIFCTIHCTNLCLITLLRALSSNRGERETRKRGEIRPLGQYLSLETQAQAGWKLEKGKKKETCNKKVRCDSSFDAT